LFKYNLIFIFEIFKLKRIKVIFFKN